MASEGRWRCTRPPRGRFDASRASYLETASALVTAAEDVDPRFVVGTQGHVLTSGDWMRTLAVEATVHHLDLVAHLPTALQPAKDGLACVRATIDALLDRSRWTGATGTTHERPPAGYR
ncbi:maleylpyruvate isomerase N-terminal domain-containing protein [Streptomyces griseofuscus]|uniref:maleylpyruvate isomerase N-terminal domain-containing protein n=1 Tax=Streptomyces griseofuscus TaxID=146922 RepID=UPI0037873C95